MKKSIAFVGAGPTTAYTLAALIKRRPVDVHVTIFEAQSIAGPGTPYRATWNDAAMLANIASVEIPPIMESLLEWARRQGNDRLRRFEVDPDAIDERSFLPRLALGAYFEDQMSALVAEAKALGIAVTLRTGCQVDDVLLTPDGVRLTFADGVQLGEGPFDRVVLATGHQWPARRRDGDGYLSSPWPSNRLAQIPPVEIGIRGSSLTAIDVAIALASRHGAFVDLGDRLVYEPAADTEGFRMTMMSRRGLLPEADFYFPLPHAPLRICTPAALKALIAAGGPELLDQAFDLFRQELAAVDPAYARAVGLDGATLEAFAEAYFAERAATDPFVWAKANLKEARRNHQAQHVVPWRDAILRMHETIAAIVPHLDGLSYERFNRLFKPIFVDNYAAVPHRSIERLLALHEAGKLEVIALGRDRSIDIEASHAGAVLDGPDGSRAFQVFIEATGQRPLSGIQFPFLSLLEQGIVQDAVSEDAPERARGIVVDDAFRPLVAGQPVEHLHVLSLPFIMGRHPFVQGITSSHAMGESVGRSLADGLIAHQTPVEASSAEAA